MNRSLGDVVCSRAGRDAGKYFVIIGSPEDNYVFVSDGAVHKLASPKKKKLKHLCFTGKNLETIAQKLESGQKVFDSELRNAIESLNLTEKGEE